MMCEHCNTYKYLEPRPQNWRNQLWIKKSHGRGYQTQMNDALREYMEAQQR